LAPLIEVSPEFVGLAYPAVVHKVLTLQPNRHPLTVDQIVEVMAMHGVVPDSQDPRNTVKTALNRRKATNGDVIHTGLGEWGLCSWYTDSDLKKIEMAQNGANARDAALHSAKMKKGIAATKARGAHYGRAPRLTEDMWNLAVRLIADEGKSMAVVHSEVSKLLREGEEPISKGTLWLRREELLGRKPYPPKWRKFFESRKNAQTLKAELNKTPPMLRSVT
jgi:hypothetical protein